jgi:hypothetical protein
MPVTLCLHIVIQVQFLHVMWVPDMFTAHISWHKLLVKLFSIQSAQQVAQVLLVLLCECAGVLLIHMSVSRRDNQTSIAAAAAGLSDCTLGYTSVMGTNYASPEVELLQQANCTHTTPSTDPCNKPYPQHLLEKHWSQPAAYQPSQPDAERNILTATTERRDYLHTT